MSSLGGQWRVIRHYLSLSNLHSEVDKLVQKLKPASPEQWDNLIKKFEKVVSTQVSSSKDVVANKLQESEVKATAVGDTTDSKLEGDSAESPQREGPAEGRELTVEGLWQGLKLKKDIHLGKISEPVWKPNKNVVSKVSLQSRTSYVVGALGRAASPEGVLRRTESLIDHLHQYPEARDYAVKEGCVRALLRVRRAARPDRPLGADIRGAVQEALALAGYTGPPRWAGANVLSLDGGGIRGIISIEILRHLERLTGRRVHELFDYVVGVSTGAIIAAVVGGGRSLDDARRLYLTLSRDMFGNTTRLGGASRLVWSHSYYDTAAWERLLRAHLQDCTLSSCNRRGAPRLAVLSCVVNAGARLAPFLFRSYEARYRVRSALAGTSRAHLWHAVRASAAAPTYFEEFRLHGLLHQDGGILLNNPCGVGVHEARLLYGDRALRAGCVVSVGTGRALGPHRDYSRLGAEEAPSPAPTSWRDKFNKILDSATDTEGVHLMMSDLLPPGNYYRFNPPLMAECAMDEVDPHKLDNMLEDTAAYIRRNSHKLERAAARLTRTRSLAQRLGDYVSETAIVVGAVPH